jgi:hypothetical protein
MLENKLAAAEVSEEEQKNLLKDLERRKLNTCAVRDIKWELMTSSH